MSALAESVLIESLNETAKKIEKALTDLQEENQKLLEKNERLFQIVELFHDAMLGETKHDREERINDGQSDHEINQYNEADWISAKQKLIALIAQPEFDWFSKESWKSWLLEENKRQIDEHQKKFGNLHYLITYHMRMK